MATMADYVVLRDASFTLKKDDEKTLPTITLASNVSRGRGQSKPILAYVADPSDDAKDLKYEIWINEKRIETGSFSGGVKRGLWEVFTFPENNDITIQFKVESGTGKVRFQDVVLWFQRTGF